MAGDRTLSLLIDIRARSMFSGVFGMLGSAFSGIGNAVGNLVFGFKNLGTAGTIGMDAIKAGAMGLLSSFLLLAAALAAIAVAIGVGIGIAAVKAAGDFQQAMLKVYALTGMSTSAFDQMTASILAMAPAVATGPTELAKALYPIESDGFKGANALNVLRLSAIAAKVGLTDVNTVAFALTSAIRAFGFADNQATYVMNIMNNTVRQGKMEWEAYAVQVGRIATAAKTAGVSFLEENAALATLTQSGSSVSRATTLLINLFNQMNLKTDAMAKHAAAAGIAFNEQAFKAMNLGQQIDYLTKITHGSSTEMMKLMGNNSIAVRAYELLAQHSKTYADILKSLNLSQQKGNDLMASWAKTQQGLNIQVDRAKAAFQVLLIVIGNQLLPYVTKLAAQIVPLVTQFANWFTRSNALSGVLAAVSQTVAFIAPAVMTVVGALAAFFGWITRIIASLHLQNEALIVLKGLAIVVGVALLLMLAPFIVLAVAVVAVIVGIMLAIRYLIVAFNWAKQAGIDAWNWIRTAAMNTWNWIKTAWGNIGAFFTGVWASVKNTATGAWNGLVAFLRGVWATIQGIFKGAIDAIVGSFAWLYNHNYYFKALVDFIRNTTSSVLTWLRTAWNNTVSWLGARWNDMKGLATSAWNGVKGVFQAVWGWISGILSSLWSHISSWWSSTASGVRTKATDLWTQVKGVFASAWSTYISGPLSSLWNSFSNWASNLAKAAWQWGVNLVQQFINGLLSMLGSLLSAAANLAGQVAKALGFHSPPPWGPARDSDLWAPNFVKMFARGLLDGIPLIQRASALMASAMGGDYSGSYSLSGSSFGGGRYPSGGTTIVIMPPGPVRSVVYLDKKEVGYQIMDWAGTDTRRHGGPQRR